MARWSCAIAIIPTALNNIAALCDKTGRIFGLCQILKGTALAGRIPAGRAEGLKKEGDGLRIFRNGVEYARKYL